MGKHVPIPPTSFTPKAVRRRRYRAQERNKGARNQAQRRRLTARVWARDGGQCQLCGGPVGEEEATLDRIDPAVRYQPDNVWTAHPECNVRKGGQILPRFCFRAWREAR